MNYDSKLSVNNDHQTALSENPNPLFQRKSDSHHGAATGG